MLREKLNKAIKGRTEIVHSLIDLSKDTLEISPNWAPLIIQQDLKPSGKLSYCDRIDTEKLIEREKLNPSRISLDLEVMSLHFIWESGEPSLFKSAGKKFDQIVSSHVAEHVPNLLQHLISIHEALTEDGCLVMVLPNSMGTGEYFRPLSCASDLIDLYIRGEVYTTPKQNWEYLKNIVHYDPKKQFVGRKKSEFDRCHTNFELLQDVVRCRDEYVDVHCWAFTPNSFKELIDQLVELNISPFIVEAIIESPVKTLDNQPFEFTVKCVPNKSFSLPYQWKEYLNRQLENKKIEEQNRLLTEALKELDLERAKSTILLNQCQNLNQDVTRMLTSKSWRYTKPIRRLYSKIRRLYIR